MRIAFTIFTILFLRLADARAQSFPADIMQATPIEGLEWTTREIRSQGGGGKKAFTASLAGRFNRPGWTLSARGATLTGPRESEFQVKAKLSGTRADFTLTAKGPNGESDESTIAVIFANGADPSLRRMAAAAVPPPPPPPPARRAAPKPEPKRFTASRRPALAAAPPPARPGPTPEPSPPPPPPEPLQELAVPTPPPPPEAPPPPPEAPPPPPAPAPEVRAKALAPLQLYLLPRFSYFKLAIEDRINGGTGTLSSGLNYGVGVSIVPWYRKHVDSFVSVSIENISVQTPPGASFDATSASAWGAAVGVGVTPFGEILRVWASLGYRTIYLVRALDQSGKFTIDQRGTPAASGGLSVELVHWGPVILGIEASGSLLFPTMGENYGVKSTPELAGKLFTGYDFSWGQFRASAGGLTQSLLTTSVLDSTLVTSAQTKTEVALEVGFGFRF